MPRESIHLGIDRGDRPRRESDGRSVGRSVAVHPVARVTPRLPLPASFQTVGLVEAQRARIFVRRQFEGAGKARNIRGERRYRQKKAMFPALVV